MRKLLAVLFLMLLMLQVTTVAIATSYIYVADGENLFDDSNTMISLCAEIRNKLDFNIEIISIPELNEKDPIIEERKQDSTAFLIFVSPDEEMDYWVGSAVEKTIRDVELELLFSTYKITDKQYTKTVNSILSAIIEVYINKEDLEKYVEREELVLVNPKQDSWFIMTCKYAINFVKTHPVRIIIGIAFLICVILYYHNFRKSKKDE